MTNKEWLMQLCTEDFARFMIGGLLVMKEGYEYPICVSAHDIGLRSTISVMGFIEWLNQPQEYEVCR